MRGRDPCRNSDKSYVGSIYFEGPALVDADRYAACLSQEYDLKMIFLGNQRDLNKRQSQSSH